MREFYITNKYGVTVDFNLNSPYRITDITGLSSNDSEFSESQNAGNVGSTFAQVKIASKDITIEGDIKTFDYLDRRKFLDTMIPGSVVRLRLVDKPNDIDHYIDAYLSKTPVIEESQEVYKSFQLVLKCAYPYWRDNNNSVVNFVNYVSGFRFPRSFSGTEPWKIGTKQIKQLLYIDNQGSDQTGFTVRFEASGYVKAPEILKILTQEHIRFTDLEMSAGDVVIVSTYENERYCKRVRNGVEENIYYLMDDDSNFWVLDKGSNPVRYGSSGSVDNLACSVNFANTYVGE